jgi:hypothetical protein
VPDRGREPTLLRRCTGSVFHRRCSVNRYLLLTLAAVVAAAALVPGLALGKGARAATVRGPGLESPIRLGGSGEPGSGGQLGRVAQSAGFFEAVFGQTPDPMLAHRPRGTLGPRYRITYVMPGPNGNTGRIRQDLYPYATPAPVTYMASGQRFWTTERTHGGWFVAPQALRRQLIAAGLPTRAPA